MTEKRIHYLDNIRITLTAIVIIHHVLVSYGAPGGWYYKEFEIYQLDLPTLIILVFTTAINQAYFMGFFFFISGYFSARSLQKTTPVRFLGGRLLRLGVPILFFVYLISPLIRLLIRWILFRQPFSPENFERVYRSIRFGPELGPMWFAVLLLILSWALLPFLARDRFAGARKTAPAPVQIILFGLLIGCLTFLVRIFQPVGTVFRPLNLQLPHTTQYVFLFWAGSLVYHKGWLDRIEESYSRFWFLLIAGLLLALPVVFIFSGGLEGDAGPALGGLTWQSLAYSIWEQLFCLSLIVIFLRWFQLHANKTAPVLKELALSSYAAYLIHPLVLVVIASLIDPVKIHPLAKISLALVPGLVLTFLAASLLRRLPGLRRVL